MTFFINDAFAQGGGDPTGGMLSLLPLIVIFVLFYFLLIRPQQKRQKQHKDMVTTLKKGDEVVTAGGTLGRITDVGDNFISLEIARGVEVKVQKTSVQMMMPKGTVKES
jgi:preprotein translocase subunit YajC